MTEDQFVARFRQGRVLPGSPMPWQGFARLTEEDLRAIYRYLKSVPPVKNDVGPPMVNVRDAVAPAARPPPTKPGPIIGTAANSHRGSQVAGDRDKGDRSNVARATTPGVFVRPPVHAEEMYNPAVNGRSDGGVFTVTAKGP